MLSIDEAIAQEREMAEKNKQAMNFKSEDNIDDDIKVNFLNCATKHEQFAEWLEKLKAIKEMDLSIPQHFTKEQSDWIKAYCIQRNKEFYNKAIDDFVKKINESNQGHWRPTRYEHGEVVSETMSYDIGTIRLIAEQLKEGGDNGA